MSVDSLRRPMVYLVGAGSGDPGLLTLRGLEVLQQADFILYDQLVSPRVLEILPVHIERVCIRELPGNHPDRWPHIHERLIAEARRNRIVVRLKGGDPLIFGRGGEEAEALREAAIPYEIVPGVTAALSAGAYLDVPLTHRSFSSAIAFVTGHEHPNKENSRLDWKGIAGFPGTLAIYMGMGRVGAITEQLIRHGRRADTPALVVHRISTGEQRSAVSTLEHLDEVIRREGLTSPSLILIGDVVKLKPEKSWFEIRPLLNRRVLITRPRHQAEPMVRRLELLGAVSYLLPMLEIVDIPDSTQTDQALNRLNQDGFDWVIFTSTNGVDSFFRKLAERNTDVRIFGRTRIAAIGTATAESLRSHQIRADFVPAESSSEGLLSELREHVTGKRLLLVQVADGREILREDLAKISELSAVAFYAQVVPTRHDEAILDLLRRGEIDAVTLTSPNIAAAFLKTCDATILGRLERGDLKLISNSARLSDWLRAKGLPVAGESPKPSLDSLIEAVVTTLGP